QRAPETVWKFIAKWGRHRDPDLRAAVATCLLEHLLEHHFEKYIDRVEELAIRDTNFADTVCTCWEFGRTELPNNMKRLRALKRKLRRRAWLYFQLSTYFSTFPLLYFSTFPLSFSYNRARTGGSRMSRRLLAFIAAVSLIAAAVGTVRLAAQAPGLRWVKAAPFPEPEEELYAVTVNGKMYVI